MGDHAELMALGIGQRLPRDAERRDRRSESDRAELLQPPDVAGGVVRVHVDVHAVLHRLGLGHRLQDQHRPGWFTVAWREDPVPVEALDELVGESLLPEGQQGVRVEAVENDGDSHPATLVRPAILLAWTHPEDRPRRQGRVTTRAPRRSSLVATMVVTANSTTENMMAGTVMRALSTCRLTS